jgi:hypothetical protein
MHTHVHKFPARRTALEPTEIRIVVDTGPESDERELADATRELRSMLLSRPVESVVIPAGDDAPMLSKSADLQTVGVLLVSVAPAVITAVTDIVRAWSERQAGRSVRVEIDGNTLELTGISKQQAWRNMEDFWSRIGQERPEDDADGNT